MTKSLYRSFIIPLIFFMTLSIYSEANYYTDMIKIDRKTYVAVTQQKMLNKTLIKEKRKAFNAARIRAYKKMIKKIHREELGYREEKTVLQKKIRSAKDKERIMEKSLSSIPGDVHIRVNRRQQTMEVYKGKTLIYSWLCSTGKNGFTTPQGHYHPYHTTKMHYSRKWNNSPMPYSVFYYKGFAIHGTNYIRSLGRRASHGCIRLSTRNARKVYNLAKKYGYKRVHIKVT